MNEEQQEQYNEILEGFEVLYAEFLEAEHLRDGPMVRYGFMQSVLQVILELPFEDRVVHDRVVIYFRAQILQASDQGRNTIEAAARLLIGF